MIIVRAPACAPLLPPSVLSILLALGCGPAGGLDSGSGDGSGGTASDTITQTSTESGATSSTPTSTTGASTSAADGTTATDDTSSGEPPSICEPQPVPGVVAWVSVDGGALPPEPVANPYVYACTIASMEEGDALTTLALACEDGDHTLELGTSVGIWFDPSGDFELSVIHSNDTYGSEDQLVTLRRADGELVLAGASTPWAPDDASIPADFFAPLDVTLLPDVCAVEPEPADDGGFVGPCFTVERQALRFEQQGQAVEVYERGVDQLPPYVLLVQHAEQRFDVECTDTPGRWYSWLAVPPILD